MPRDRSLPLRQAVITRLRDDSDLTQLVPAARHYGMKVEPTPAWPFTRYGTPDTLPRRGQCWDGQETDFTIHSFSKQSFEDECAQINAAIVASLGDAVLALDGGGKATIGWLGSQIIPDGGEAGAWHGLNRFRATVT